MAYRHWIIGIASAVLSVALTGCQQNSREASTIPPPSFEAPRVIEHAKPKPLELPMPTIAYKPLTALPTPLPQEHPSVASDVPADWIPPVPPRAWKWIIVHHSASRTGDAAVFDRDHRARGWDELGYDFVIGNGTDTPDGLIEVGPRWRQQRIGAHDKTPGEQYNKYGVGICMVGNFDLTYPTQKQLHSLERLCAFLMDRYHIPPWRVLGHGQTKATDCPGKHTNMALIRQRAAEMAGMTGYANAEPSSGTELLTSLSR